MPDRKVLLISPPGNTAMRLYSISEMGGLTAALRQAGFRTDMIDMKRPADLPERAALAEAVAVVPVFQWTSSVFAADGLPRLLEDIEGVASHLNLCGRGATLYWKHILERYPHVDSIVLGEGERTLVDLIRCLSMGEAWTKQPGLAYRDRERVVRGEPGFPVDDLDKLPFAARDYMSRRRDFPVVPISTSRSCYGRCTFCGGRLFRQATPPLTYRARSATNVADELEQLVGQYKARFFYFVDDNFLDGPAGRERARQLAAEIRNRRLRIRFQIEARANEVEPGIMSILKEVGLRKVFIGFESGSQQALERYDKGATVEDNYQAIEVLRHLGLRCEPSIIMFDPETTLEELSETINFVRRSSIHDMLPATMLFRRMEILPDSEEEQRYIAAGGNPERLSVYPIGDERVARAETTVRYFLEESDRQILSLRRSAQGQGAIPLIQVCERWYNGLSSLGLDLLEEIVRRESEGGVTGEEMCEQIHQALARYRRTCFDVNVSTAEGTQPQEVMVS